MMMEGIKASNPLLRGSVLLLLLLLLLLPHLVLPPRSRQRRARSLRSLSRHRALLPKSGV
jgi:hypothetical protein